MKLCGATTEDLIKYVWVCICERLHLWYEMEGSELKSNQAVLKQIRVMNKI